MDTVLRSLRDINTSLQQIKLDKKKAEAFPKLLKVLKWHTRSTDYMIPFSFRAAYRRLRKQVGMQRRPPQAGAYATIGIR